MSKIQRAEGQQPEPRKLARAEAFRDAEASLLLEGLDPTKDQRYLAIKAQLIHGTLSFDEAEAAIRALFGSASAENALPASA